MITETQKFPIGRQVSLPGHFDVRFMLEAARPLVKDFECRVRMPDGTLEEVVITYENARGWDCPRVGHQKIGLDICSMGPSDQQTAYRDPVTSIRRIEERRKRGATIRLTTRCFDIPATAIDQAALSQANKL